MKDSWGWPLASRYMHTSVYAPPTHIKAGTWIKTKTSNNVWAVAQEELLCMKVHNTESNGADIPENLPKGSCSLTPSRRKLTTVDLDYNSPVLSLRGQIQPLLPYSSILHTLPPPKNNKKKPLPFIVHCQILTLIPTCFNEIFLTNSNSKEICSLLYTIQLLSCMC